MRLPIDTGERQILSFVAAAMFFGKHVLYLQRRQRRMVLMQATILAAVPCAFTNETLRGRADCHE